jgi:erythronate-4-phosphate dehydrogenase
LLVRSITRVNQNLLQHSRIKFVGSGTAGTDHMDLTWLQNNHISYATAKGCNAIAVAEYVVCSIAALQKQGLLTGKKLRAGVVGVGYVGREVVTRLKALGFEVLVNDPPRALQEPDFISMPLTDFQDLDLICLHTPLTTSGDHATHHLINQDFLQRQKPGCVLLNAGRGEVIAVEDLWHYGQHLLWCFDVWPDEPNISVALLHQAKLATPHIAGYTVEAKLRAVHMLYQAAQLALQLPGQSILPSPFDGTTELKLASAVLTWQDILLSHYNPLLDTENTRSTLLACNSTARGQCFDELRQHHPQRHELSKVHILLAGTPLPLFDSAVLQQLGFVAPH